MILLLPSGNQPGSQLSDCSGAHCEFPSRRPMGSNWPTRGVNRTGGLVMLGYLISHVILLQKWGELLRFFYLWRTNAVQLSRRDGGRSTVLSYRYSQRWHSPSFYFVLWLTLLLEISCLVRDTMVYYWSLPRQFLGNKLGAYGGNLTFFQVGKWRFGCVPNNRDDQETQMVKNWSLNQSFTARSERGLALRDSDVIMIGGQLFHFFNTGSEQTNKTNNQQNSLYRERRDSLLHRAPSRESARRGGQVVLAMRNIVVNSILIGILSTAGWWHFCRQKVQAGAQILALRTLLRENNSWGRWW